MSLCAAYWMERLEVCNRKRIVLRGYFTIKEYNMQEKVHKNQWWLTCGTATGAAETANLMSKRKLSGNEWINTCSIGVIPPMILPTKEDAILTKATASLLNGYYGCGSSGCHAINREDEPQTVEELAARFLVWYYFKKAGSGDDESVCYGFLVNRFSPRHSHFLWLMWQKAIRFPNKGGPGVLLVINKLTWHLYVG